MKRLVIIVLLLTPFLTVAQTKKEKRDTVTLNCELVKKQFLKKNGELSGVEEYYLRCSVQDYFIKFCESKVKSTDLSKYLDKGLSVQAEIVNGNFDICPGDPAEKQSRVGYYVTIIKIKE